MQREPDDRPESRSDQRAVKPLTVLEMREHRPDNYPGDESYLLDRSEGERSDFPEWLFGAIVGDGGLPGWLFLIDGRERA